MEYFWAKPRGERIEKRNMSWWLPLQRPTLTHQDVSQLCKCIFCTQPGTAEGAKFQINCIRTSHKIFHHHRTKQRTLNNPPLISTFLREYYEFFAAVSRQEIPTTGMQKVRGLSTDEFVTQYESRCLPVIITDLADDWPASKEWKFEALFNGVGGGVMDSEFRCGEDRYEKPLKLKMKHFLWYMHHNSLSLQTDDGKYNGQRDESFEEDLCPMYIFDPTLGGGNEAAPLQYEVPPLFSQDLFKHLGPKRPPYRWLLVGPARSGSYVHIDPLATSAWNTLLDGKKYWVLFPPNIPESIVRPPKRESSNNFDDCVVERESALHWYRHVLPELRRDPRCADVLVEVLQLPGETIFVPGGWWHAVLNLTDTIAVTQNFVSSVNFKAVWQETLDRHPTVAHEWLTAFTKSGDIPHLIQEVRDELLRGNPAYQRMAGQMCDVSADTDTGAMQTNNVASSIGTGKRAPLSSNPLISLLYAIHEDAWNLSKSKAKINTMPVSTSLPTDLYRTFASEAPEGDDEEQTRLEDRKVHALISHLTRTGLWVCLPQPDPTLNGLTPLHVTTLLGLAALPETTAWMVIAARALLHFAHAFSRDLGSQQLQLQSSTASNNNFSYCLTALHARDRLGRTVLHVAAENDRVELVNLFLEFHAAHQHNPHDATAEILLKTRDQGGRAVLFAACERGAQRVVKSLMDFSFAADLVRSDATDAAVSLNATSDNGKLMRPEESTAGGRFGRTALHGAAEGGHVHAIAFLLRRKANLYAQDGSGKTPLDCARACGHGAAVQILERVRDHGYSPTLLLDVLSSGR